MSDDLARHVLGRLPRRLSSRADADDRGVTGSAESSRIVAAIAGRLGVEPRVVALALAERRPPGMLERTE